MCACVKSCHISGFISALVPLHACRTAISLHYQPVAIVCTWLLQPSSATCRLLRHMLGTARQERSVIQATSEALLRETLDPGTDAILCAVEYREVVQTGEGFFFENRGYRGYLQCTLNRGFRRYCARHERFGGKYNIYVVLCRCFCWQCCIYA